MSTKNNQTNYDGSNRNESNRVSLWERYFTKEVGIEFKTCLYFFAFLFYYCTYRICVGLMDASILHMAEMIFLNYAMCYVQVFLLWNFDEAERIGGKEVFAILLCTALYTLAATLLHWFDQNAYVIMGFAAYVIFMYLCMFWVYWYRRRIDEKILNEELLAFKKKQAEEKVQHNG